MAPAPMDLLSRGVPLSLLIDLVLGPQSQDLLDHEGFAPQDEPDQAA